MARGIAYRRAKLARLKKHFAGWWQYATDSVQRGIAAHSPKRCSCWICGNPRKYFGEWTVQEKRQVQRID